ncbi:MAG: ribonuclease R [Oscillospiraceae bacterium]
MARHNRKHELRKHRHEHQPKTSTRPVNPKLQEEYTRKIQIFLKTANMNRMRKTDLANHCRWKRSPSAFNAALEQLVHEGIIRKERNFYYLCKDSFQAETVRIHPTFGFIRDEQGTEYFVAGKYLLGSLVGDKVIARSIEPHGDGTKEAEILSIAEESPDTKLSGKIVLSEDGEFLRFLPDTMGFPMHISYKDSVRYGLDDKVICTVVSRGERHRDHIVKVLVNFGSTESAENCMNAKIMAQNIPVEFPAEVLKEAEKLQEDGITSFDLENRLDLRNEIIFTIDGAHSKDLDDAVSVQKKEDGGYVLGVHIADVSHYVRNGTPLDAEAFERGTSIYYADKVIPMLPKALSNGICSLNPNEDRLTISCIMQISPEGDLLEGKFYKSVICSKVRGVYDECNQILDGSAPPEILEKYAPVVEMLHLLDELSGKLEHLRKLRGAPELESTESALILDENGICVGLAPIERGRSECIIECCMLSANECSARLAREKQFPLVHRVHENPSPERIETLKNMLLRLGAEPPKFAEIQPKDIQKLLDDCRNETWFPVVNSLTLRSMAKAKYSHEPLGHFGLALKDYAHFTSPIRRYPDLAVHRIISDFLAGASSEWLQKRYAKFAENAGLHSSDTELRAVQLERDADACYSAEYMQSHIGEVFHGVITSVTEYGLYVTLENRAEGLLHINDLPEGAYEIEEGWYIKDSLTGKEWKLGNLLDVLCARADVNSGHIDFVLAEET